MGQIFQELKRRNVIRVAAAYGVVGWLLIQMASVIETASGLPAWFDGLVVGLVAIGFPLALLFAWAFEMTPEGLKKTRDVDKAVSVTPATGRRIDRMIIAALVVLTGFLLVDRFTGAPVGGVSPVSEAQAAETSIAVLPFVNMSDDAANDYFSDGMSEEILNVLARIPDLQVTSRSSAFQFKGHDIDIPTVARQLGVANVLEGSVRKSGTRVRITAQLIDAVNDRHLWSETYDRELTDIFAVQDEISAAIVAALKQTMGIDLTPAPAPEVRAVANPQAHDAYLLGRFLIRKRTKGDIEASIPNFERAIELDPDYAPAHAALGLAWRLLMRDGESYGTLTLEQMLAKALPHVERALALDPELAEAHGVMGLVFEAQGKAEQAVVQYETALRLNPSLTNVRNWYSSALSSLGREAEAFREIETAYRLDPLSRLTGNNYANDLRLRRRFDDLEPVLARMDQINPAVSTAFRGAVLAARGLAADGAITVLRGADASPGVLRLTSLAAVVIRDMGLDREALRLWPYPDGGWGIIGGGTDYPRILAMAKERYENDPDNPATLAALAWAYFNAGNREQAARMAVRHLARLGPAARPLAQTNIIAGLGASPGGDEAAMLARLAPLEAAADTALNAGIDITDLHWFKAQAAFLRGRTDEAYEQAKRALSMAPLSPGALDAPYRHLGWDKLPRFVALRDDYLAYLTAERLKLLAVACAEDGFKSWQPLPETCAAAGRQTG